MPSTKLYNILISRNGVLSPTQVWTPDELDTLPSNLIVRRRKDRRWLDAILLRFDGWCVTVMREDETIPRTYLIHNIRIEHRKQKNAA